MNTKEKNGVILIKRDKRKIDFFIDEYINQGDLTRTFCFSFNEMKEKFNSTFKVCFNVKMCLMLEDLLEYIELVNKKGIQEYIVERLPNGIFIRRPFLINKKFVPILFTEDIPQKFNKEYSPFISANEIEINKYLKEKGLVLRHGTKNENEYIITYETNRVLIHIQIELAEQLKEIFLKEKVGYEKPIEEIERYYPEYDVVINELVFEKAVEYANHNLVDIKIIYDKKENILKSEFNKRFAGEIVVTDLTFNLIVECPVCGIKSTPEEIRNHILNKHTSWESKCSILQQLGQDRFYCSHCDNDELRLYSSSYVATIGHITGECKNKDFWNKK